MSLGASLLLGPDAKGLSVLCDGERIAWVGVGEPDMTAAARVPCKVLTLAPGWVNAHTHLYSGLVPLGMPPVEPPPRSFLQILERLWWRLDRALDADTLAAAARYYVAEALLAGTTTLVDHHESPELIEGSLDILADACSALGARAVLTYGASERNGGENEAKRGLAECARFVRQNRRPTVLGMVGLHASFTVSDEAVAAAGRLAADLAVPLHIHMAEDIADVDDAHRRGFAGPLERLDALTSLPPGSILAHGVHLDAEQVHKSNERRAWLVQNPRSNRGNGVGYPRALGVSTRVALGTDGYPASMGDEQAALEEEARENGEAPDVATRRLAAGWQLLEERFGLPFGPTLAPGHAADIIAYGPQGVRHVVVAGRLVVRDGALVEASRVTIRSEAEQQAHKLWQTMRQL